MRGKTGRTALAACCVPVRMSRIKQIGIPAKADYILEKVKCHDIIVFSEMKSMSDQMQPIREKIIGILHRNDVKKSLLDLAHLKNELEDTISMRVDVLTYKSMHSRLKERILAEQVPII